VARESLLALADVLASSHNGLENKILRLESHDEEQTVLTENRSRGWSRRFRLGHSYWPGAHRLCQETGCRHELDQHRTLCGPHMKAAGPSAVREQTSLVAGGLRMDRETEGYTHQEAMRNLMEAAIAVGIPAAVHARYFAERLNLADADTAEEWDFDEREHEIRQDEVRLLASVPAQREPDQALATRGAARQIGPLDPLQLPGSPAHLRLEFSCTTDGLPSGEPQDDTIQYWNVDVHHRVPDGAPAGENDLGQIGRLHLARLAWGQDPEVLDTEDDAFCAGRTAEAAFDAVDDPHSPIHHLGIGEDGDLLLVLKVELDPVWRGFGLGALLTRQALNILDQGCRVVATTCVADADSPAGRLAHAAGFRPVSSALAVLDRTGGKGPQETGLNMYYLDHLVSLSHPDRGAAPPC
jgi:hypothetical protein